MRAAILLTAILFCLPAVAAQALSPDSNVLYVHGDLSMQTTPAGSGTTEGGPLTDTETWTLTMSPPLATQTSLDLAGTVDFVLTMGGSVHVGEVDVSVRLQNGATLVAEGAPQAHSLRTGYTALTWSVVPLVDRLDPSAGNLVATVTASGTASSYYLDTEESRITLPVLAPALEAPAVHNLTIDDARLARDFAFNTTTNRTDVITWSQGPADATMVVAANVTGGHVNITISDANGTVAFNGTVSDPTAMTTNLTGLAPGNWTVGLHFTNFTGELSMTLDMLEATPDEEMEGPDGMEPDGNGTTEEQDSPGASAFVALLAAIAIVARRRR